jgi:Domain of unknown function (DUF4440)
MLLRRSLMLMASIFAGNAYVYADGLGADSPTFQQVRALDQKLFQAYNTCDLTTLGDLVDDGLEFYHDKSGLSVGKANFLNAIKNNICHKVRRELVAATLEVYSLENYGAIELGEHTFCNMAETPVCKEETNGIGKFFMLWQKQGDHYRLTRVVSYDHLSDHQRKSNKRKMRRP